MFHQAARMLEHISSSPMSGSYRDTIENGTVYLSWEFGVGAYLFVVAAITRFVAGTILSSSSAD